jgi:hypothetical protein
VFGEVECRERKMGRRVMGNNIWHVNKAHFALGVKANVLLKSSIPIGAKVEISPKCLALGVKG